MEACAYGGPSSEHVTSKADVWSYGVCLWELLTLEVLNNKDTHCPLPTAIAPDVRMFRSLTKTWSPTLSCGSLLSKACACTFPQPPHHGTCHLCHPLSPLFTPLSPFVTLCHPLSPLFTPLSPFVTLLSPFIVLSPSFVTLCHPLSCTLGSGLPTSSASVYPTTVKSDRTSRAFAKHSMPCVTTVSLSMRLGCLFRSRL